VVKAAASTADGKIHVEGGAGLLPSEPGAALRLLILRLIETQSQFV
jgi:hypothetical protein